MNAERGDRILVLIVRCALRMATKPPPGNRPLKTLERVLSKAGVGSRTEARRWVGEGRVRVNGRVAGDPDQWVDLERDRVTFVA